MHVNTQTCHAHFVKLLPSRFLWVSFIKVADGHFLSLQYTQQPVSTHIGHAPTQRCYLLNPSNGFQDHRLVTSNVKRRVCVGSVQTTRPHVLCVSHHA